MNIYVRKLTLDEYRRLENAHITMDMHGATIKARFRRAEISPFTGHPTGHYDYVWYNRVSGKKFKCRTIWGLNGGTFYPVKIHEWHEVKR